jgi:hypothetical protein
MIRQALQAGGHDNVSVGIFRAVVPAAVVPAEATSRAAHDTRRIPAMGGDIDESAANISTRILSAFKN